MCGGHEDAGDKCAGPSIFVFGIHPAYLSSPFKLSFLHLEPIQNGPAFGNPLSAQHNFPHFGQISKKIRVIPNTANMNIPKLSLLLYKINKTEMIIADK